MSDDILDEVQKARQAYGEKFGFDLEAMGLDLREQEGRSGRKIVNYASDRFPPPEGITPTNEAAPAATSSTAARES